MADMFEHSAFENRLKDVIDYLYLWEDEARRDFQFYALDQWTEEDKKRLETQRRAALTFDRTRPIIDSVAGSEITNRYMPKFLPRETELESGDPIVSESLSELFRWVRGIANTEHHESQAFRSCVICGIGVTETTMNYDISPDGAIYVRRVPIWEMGWDPSSMDQNMADARYIIRDRWVPEEEVASLFGVGSVKKVIEAAKQNRGTTSGGGFFGRIWTREIDDSRNAYIEKKGRRYYDKRHASIRLWEMQRKEKRYMTRIMIPPALSGTNKPEELFTKRGKETDDALQALNEQAGAWNREMETLQASNPNAPVQPAVVDWVEEYPVVTVHRSFHTGAETLKDEELPVSNFTYQFLTCFEDWSEDERRYFFGLMRPMRDPQEYANKFFSQAVHVWSSNPKGALLYEEGLFEDVEVAKDQYASPTGMIPVRAGKLSNSKKDPYVQLRSNVSLTGIHELLGHAMGSIPMSAGINESYFVGGAGDLRRTAASSIDAVQRQNLVTISQPFDALRMYKKTQALLTLQFIEKYLDPMQIIKVIGEDDAPLVEVIAAGELTKQYDVIVEESPTSQDKQMEVFSKLMETNFLPQLMQQNIAIPPSVAKYFPFPPDITVEFEGVLKDVKEVMELQATLTKAQLQIELAKIQAVITGQAPVELLMGGGPGDGGGGQPGGGQPPPSTGGEQ